MAEVSREDALAYVDALLDGQVLTSELEPFVTGPEPLPAFIESFPPLAPVRAALQEIDAGGPGTDPARYLRIADQLAAFPTAVELPRLLQVDLLRPAPEATLGRRTVRDLSRAVAILARLAPPPPRDGALEAFREGFRRRYEDREVPLLDALDEDLGIGFGIASDLGTELSPLLEGLDFPADDPPPARFGRREQLLLRKLGGSGVLELTERDVEELGRPETLPDAFAAVATLLPGDELLLHAAVGPSGALLLGRFCHGDPELLARVREHLRAEERLRPEAVFAEVVHLPQGRSGNILCRPLLREYEIPYLGRSGAPPDRQIAATDLCVSVRGDRVVLRSRRLGKEVVPRLTTAHNFAGADVGFYRFLCSLQAQDGSSVNWDWGALSAAPFLPRVRVGRVVLAPAAWKLFEEDLRELSPDSARSFRERRGLPRLVAFAEYDNRLPVDFDNPLSVETFCQLAKGKKEALLLEALPGALVESPEGALAHELVVPFVRKQSRAAPMRTPAGPGEARRSFEPGSEWLYLKIFTGVAAADDVLRALAPALADVPEWFFIRYADPDFHLRLRVRGAPGVLRRLNEALRPLRSDGRVFRTATDTYEREIERYGGALGIELAERIFFADSSAALRILLGLSGDGAVEARWQLCLLGIDGYFDAFGLDARARRRLLDEQRRRFAAEFRADTAFERKLDRKYRAATKLLEELLAGGGPELVAAGREALRERDHRLTAVAGELWRAESEGRLGWPVFELVKSYIHMWTNRLLRSAGRAQELILYDFLGRAHQSRIARGRK